MPLGVEGNVTGNRHVRSSAACICPTSKLHPFRGWRKSAWGLSGNVCSVSYIAQLAYLGSPVHERYSVSSGCPLGVEYKVFRGHCLIGKVIRFAHEVPVVVPACKNCICRNALRAHSGRVSLIRNRSFERNSFRLFRCSVNKVQLVAFAQVVKVSDPVCKAGYIFVPLPKPCDGEIVFIIGQANIVSVNGRSVIKVIRPAAIGAKRKSGGILSRKHFQIVIPGVFISLPLGCRQRNILPRHFLQKRIVFSGNAGFPNIAFIAVCGNSRVAPDVADVRIVFGGDGINHAGVRSVTGIRVRVLFLVTSKPTLIATLVMPMPFLTHKHPLIATPAMCMLLLSADQGFIPIAIHKRKRIFLAVIVHIQNRAAVARNQLIIAVFAHYKMRIVLFIKRGFGTCVPLLRRGFHIAVAIVVRIFLPVHHGVVHKLRPPLCGKREVAGNGRVDEVKRGFAVQPACKRIPCTRGLRGCGDLRAVLHIEDGAHIAAAVRVERNGVGVAGVIHRDHRALRRNHSARHGARRGAAFIGLCNRRDSRARLRTESLFCFLDEAAVDLLDVVLHRILRVRYGIFDVNSNAAGRHCAGNGFLARFYHVSLNFRGIYAVWCANGKHRFIRSAQLIAVGVLIMNGKRGRRGCELRRYLRIRNNGSVALIPADKNLFVCGFIVRDCRVRCCRNCGIRVFGDRHREFALSYHERNGVFRCRLLCRLRRWVTCRIASLQNVGHRRSIRLFAFGHVDDRITLSKRKFTVAEERAAKHDKRQQHCKRFFELVHTLFSFPSSSISSVSAHTARRPAVPVLC